MKENNNGFKSRYTDTYKRVFYKVALVRERKEMKRIINNLAVISEVLVPFMAKKIEVFKVQKRALLS